MAMCTQVCMRAVGNYDQTWDLFVNHGITHYSGAPTVQLSILTHPNAHKLAKPAYTTIAGAAPTTSLIVGLENINIDVTHVYGLTESYGPSMLHYVTICILTFVSCYSDSILLCNYGE
jgi:acyl-coenzyme A synthetase/AMP-(fatty) acid ligase